MIGETIGHYRVLTELGSGGMGVVYQAEDLKLGRTVALKFLGDLFVDDPAVRDRFLREARAAAALNHPNICTIYEINDAGPRPFIVMELLEGQTLQQLLVSGPLPLATLLELAIQVADALEAAHAKGLIHRDIKPANIFITAGGRAKVVDFGLAKTTGRVMSDSNQSLIETGIDDLLVTRPGTTLGTIAYMSPEQARGESLDARSDLFSFGLVLYEMATGRRAFDGATTAVVFDGILNRMPLPPSFINPTVPRELEQVIGCAIEKAPGARYQRASDLAADLRRLRRASDPDVVASTADFVPSAAGAVSPAWDVTPAAGVQRAARLPSSATRSAASRTRRWVVAAFAAGLLMAVAGGLGWWFMHGRTMAAGAPLLVTDFENRTGDADFDGTLKQALTIDLEESPYFSVVSPQKVRQLLALMARQPDEPLTPALGREMCQRVGGGALMTGQIVRLGQTYVLTLSVEACATGDEIGREQAEATRKDDVLHALGTALSSMRGRLGESLASIRAHDKPLVEATTSSLPALKSLSLGDQQRARGSDLGSIPFYKEAVRLDRQFALAWARLGTVYSNTGENEKAKEAYEKAYELRDRASERERFYIDAHYFTTVAGDLAKAREVYELWRQSYPRDYVPVHNLGAIYIEEGELERALQAFRDASALEPHDPLSRSSAADLLVALGRFDEARRAAETELEQSGESGWAHLTLYTLDYLAGNKAGMADRARHLRGTALDLDLVETDLEIALREGRFAAVEAAMPSFIQEAEARGRVEYAQDKSANLLLVRALVGLTSDTRARVNRLLASKVDDNTSVVLAFALALAGDTARARSLVIPIWPRLQDDPAAARVLKPCFDALVALREAHPRRAIESVKVSEPWEGKLKVGPISSDVRGLAYLALGDGKAAEAQFQKRIDRAGLDPLNVQHVLAFLGVGRARALAGDAPGARKAYEEFFRLWKDADPDIPVLVQAKAEYAKLGG